VTDGEAEKLFTASHEMEDLGSNPARPGIGETSMSAVTFDPTPRIAAAASKLQSLFGTVRDAVDTFASYRIQHAVPEAELRRAEREINRYRRLMRAGPAVPR
jgi:hypothetical protein